MALTTVTSISDYKAAKSHATNIGSIAGDMKKTLDYVGQKMDEMYGTNWQSSGASCTREHFEEKRADFDVFYNNVLSMEKNVVEAANESEKADAEAKSTISNVYKV